MRKKENIIEIKEDVKVGGYVLEKGDRIKVLTETQDVNRLKVNDTVEIEKVDTSPKDRGVFSIGDTIVGTVEKIIDEDSFIIKSPEYLPTGKSIMPVDIYMWEIIKINGENVDY